MGVVYEAYDRERAEIVALKTLRRADGRWLARFKREFRAIHEMSHPNLVAVHELFDTASEPFFSMELVRGVDFLQHARGVESPSVDPLAETQASMVGSMDPVGEQPTLPRGLSDEARPGYDEPRLRAALKQLAVAVSVLHEAGKVHRDIKPSNVMVTSEGRVVLLDFGLLSDSMDESSSSDRRVVGSAAYMAPEQALSGDVSPAADWYSVGAVLFQALTGSLPHSGRTRYELMIRKQKYAAAPPRQFVPDVPPDLDSLCSDLLQREPGDRPPPGEILDRLGIDHGGSRRRDSVFTTHTATVGRPFVGREGELAALHDAYRRAASAPLIFLVEGVSGVGKSRLVERFLEELADDEPELVALSGRCYEREVVSYKAFDGIADALARHLRRLPPVQVAEAMPRRAALLGRLFPALKRVEQIAMAPEVRDLPEPHGQRRRMFAALRELFARMALRRRLVWYVDDLQWTDADSLVLLQELLAHEHALPVLLIATIRPIDDAARRGLLTSLEEVAPVERCKLTELPPAAARALVEILMPGEDATTVDEVTAEAGGHPLFLHELARHAGENGGSEMTGASLDDMLTARIDQLGETERRLLHYISVFGGPLTQEVAALASEIEPPEMTRAARVLRAANLARTNGVRKNDQIVVYHDRVREHINANLDDDLLRQIHMRLALALEQTGAAQHSPHALVRHAEAAGRATLAATHAQAAAQHAVASLAFDQAAEFYQIAIALGNHDDKALRALRIELATALVNAGRGAEAADVFVAAAETADPTTRMECRLRAAEQLLSSGHVDRGLEVVGDLLQEIGASIPATPRRALARLLWNRIRFRLRGIKWKEHHEREIADANLARLDVFKAVGVGLNMVDTIRGADFQARHLLLALELGEPLRIGRALAHEACYLLTQGERGRRRARTLIAECGRIRDQHPVPYLEGWLHTANALVSYMGGDFVPAQELYARAEQIFFEQTVGRTWELNTVRLFQLFTLRHLGEIGRLRTLSTTYMRDARRRGDLLTETSMRRVRNIAWLAEGQADAARLDLERAAWQPPQGTYHLQHYYELESRIELALFEDRGPQAIEQYADDFDRLASSLLVRIQIVRVISTWLRGRLALAAAEVGHDRDANLALARRCGKSIAREDARYSAVWSSLLAGGIAMQEGDEKGAAAALATAAEAARAQQMAHCQAAADYRRGLLIGGDTGAALVRAAEQSMRGKGVVATDRRAQIIAPGFRRP